MKREPPFEEKEWKFPVNRWFAKDEDDKVIVRDIEVGGLPPLIPTYHYKIIIFTGDIFGAGTDANVFITLLGDKVRTIILF